MSEKIIATFQAYWDRIIEALPNILTALIILIIFLLAGYYLHRLLSRRLGKWVRETIVISFAANSLKWFLYLIGIIAAVDILGFKSVVNSLIAGAGISAIIIGFAFKDIAENFLAGILLAINRPFRIGNIIEVDSHKGTVRGMDLRTTHIRNVEGKDIYIPNSMIVKNVVTNYTRDGLLRQEFVIGLDVGTDVQKAKSLILSYLKDQPEVLAKPEPNVLIKEVGEFTVDISILFWVDILKSKVESPSYLGVTIRSEIIDGVKQLLLSNGINLPSQVLEHKMAAADSPLVVRLENGKE